MHEYEQFVNQIMGAIGAMDDGRLGESGLTELENTLREKTSPCEKCGTIRDVNGFCINDVCELYMVIK